MDPTLLWTKLSQISNKRAHEYFCKWLYHWYSGTIVSTKCCQRLVSNSRIHVSEATALPTVPQTLSHFLKISRETNLWNAPTNSFFTLLTSFCNCRNITYFGDIKCNGGIAFWANQYKMFSLLFLHFVFFMLWCNYIGFDRSRFCGEGKVIISLFQDEEGRPDKIELHINSPLQRPLFAFLTFQ